ncbi:MAG: cytochrome P450 [Acidimicrobiales bacterium]
MLASPVISSMPYDNNTRVGLWKRIGRSRRRVGGRKDQVDEEIPGTLLLDPEVLGDPYPLYRRLREHAPVWEIAGTEVFIVSTFELLVEASARVADFSSNMKCLLYRDDAGLPGRFTFGDAGGQVLATADPPLHEIHRRAVFPELVTKRMEALDPEIRDLADGLVTRSLQKGTIEFMSAIGNVVPITMISRLIGFRGSNLDELWRSAVHMTRLVGSTLTLDELVNYAAGGDEVQAWIADQVDAAVKEPSEDLLGAVARSIVDGILTASEAAGILTILLSAGGESTTSLLGNAVRMLAEDPELQDHLRRNLDQVPLFVEEALRLESPFRYMMRTVPADTSLGGVEIRAGATVLLLWAAGNRDEREFEHPDEVDLSRRVPRRHVAFGRGIHHCVGAPLARIEARNVLSVLLDRTSNISLDPDHPPRWIHSLLVRRHQDLPVRLLAG